MAGRQARKFLLMATQILLLKADRKTDLARNLDLDKILRHACIS